MIVAVAMTLAACAPKPNAGAPESTRSIGSVIVPSATAPAPPATMQDTNVAEQARLSRLEREARALAKTEGCATLGACRTAPVGWRGCGGPRSYVVYCAATTDTVALFRKLEELKTAERAYNVEIGMLSTCEFRLAPKVALDGNRCRETPARPAGP